MASLKPDKSKKSGCKTFIMILQLVVAVPLFLPLPAQALETVTLQLKWLHQFQFAGYYAAKAKGYYRDAGIDVNFVEAKPGQRSIIPVLEGAAQYGVDGPNLLLTRGERKPVVALSAIFQHSPVVLIARQDNPSKSIHSLTGKRMMLDENNDEMLAYLRKEHLSADKYSLVKHSFNPQDLIDGKIDAIAAYTTNELFYLDKAGFRYLAFSPRSAGIDFYGDILYTTEQEIKAHSARVKAFREASNQGWKYALAHPEEIADLILSQYSQRKSREYLLFEAKQMKELIQPNLIEIGYMNLGRWRSIADTYADLGMLPRDVSLDGFIYDPAPKHDHTRLVLVVLILSVCLAIAVGFVVLLKRMVKHKTAHLETEIDERRRAEGALKGSEFRWKFALEGAGDGVWDWNILTGEAYLSQRYKEMLGFSDNEIVNSSDEWSKRIHPDDAPGVFAALAPYLDGKAGTSTLEYRMLCKDGSWKWILGRGMVISRDSNGKPLRMIGTITDLTERKAAEQERRSIELQMLQTQKLESLGVLAGGIAHDFNNILTTIIGNAELALLRINKESPGVDNLHKIEEAAARAADLAKQMLAYSGKGKFVIENINLNLLLQDMLHMLEISISKKAELRLNLTNDLPSVEADSTQIRQIIMNLVINASEAIGEKSGVIAVTTGCIDCNKDYQKNVWLDVNISQGLYVYLEIADTGCGMDKDTQAKLFDPFFTTKFTGRGLGMSAVLGIIKGHKGAIKLYSEPGKGTSFKILLPASSKPAKHFNYDGFENDWKGSGLVLLVDDEETVRGICKDMLQEFGFTTITANDGREAVEVFKITPGISFVILDLTMPHMDGEQCFRELRHLKPDVKVIMSSGFSENEVTQKFMGKGLAGFIQKPYKLSALKEAIQKI